MIQTWLFTRKSVDRFACGICHCFNWLCSCKTVVSIPSISVESFVGIKFSVRLHRDFHIRRDSLRHNRHEPSLKNATHCEDQRDLVKHARVTRHWTYGDFHMDILIQETVSLFKWEEWGFTGFPALSRCWFLSLPARWNMPTHANCRIASWQQRLKNDVYNIPFIANVYQSWFVNECHWSVSVCFSVLFDTLWFVCTTISIFVSPKKEIFYYTPTSLYRPLLYNGLCPQVGRWGNVLV